MSIRSGAVALLLLALAAVGARADPAPAVATPKAIGDAIDAYRKSCPAQGKGLRESSGALTWRDLDGDGRPDAIVDMAKMPCAGDFTPYCGTGGCPVLIFRGLANGNVRKLFDGQVLAYEIIGDGRRTSIRFHLHGSFCGLHGGEPCVKIVRMSGRPFAFRDE